MSFHLSDRDASILKVFVKFVAEFLGQRTTLIEAATEACDPIRREEAITFFQRHGFDGAVVTGVLLEQCAQACGWHKSVLTPQRTFAEMLECIKQHQQGLVSDGELLLALQMVPHQVKAVVAYNNLPTKLFFKVKLDAWDEDIAAAAERGVPPFGR